MPRFLSLILTLFVVGCQSTGANEDRTRHKYGPNVYEIGSFHGDKYTRYGPYPSLEKRLRSNEGLPESHNGIDIIAPAGTKLYAVTEMTITRIRKNPYCGWNMFGDGKPIGNDPFFGVMYAHVMNLKVNSGDKLKPGQLVGEIADCRPPHLHFGDQTGDENYELLLFGKDDQVECVDPTRTYEAIWSEESIKRGGPALLYPVACARK
ncbi:MAG: M23 family metallopeptidase [Hyphomicrobiales bacterium]|nr:M23 family metallopeptidase [Hyphomicrobiales bacterium]MCP5372270.1 M23 family metallopeptidase [Hyphomicrobiales bacterium]